MRESVSKCSRILGGLKLLHLQEEFRVVISSKEEFNAQRELAHNKTCDVL